MKVKTLDYVSGRTADGRVYSAMAGSQTLIDDDDENMVAMFRDFADRGLVEIAGEEDETADDEESTDDVTDDVTDDDEDDDTTVTSAEEGYDAVAQPTGQPYDDYDNRTLADLREIARDRDLPVSGNKDELIARLRGGQA